MNSYSKGRPAFLQLLSRATNLDKASTNHCTLDPNRHGTRSEAKELKPLVTWAMLLTRPIEANHRSDRRPTKLLCQLATASGWKTPDRCAELAVCEDVRVR